MCSFWMLELDLFMTKIYIETTQDKNVNGKYSTLSESFPEEVLFKCMRTGNSLGRNESNQRESILLQLNLQISYAADPVSWLHE